jgi:TolB protein
VVFADGSRWAGARGEADPDRGRRATTSTPFAVASVTKTFVAALALQLVHEGKLELDEPIARWLPGFPGADRITLRQLLGHTSGLGRGPEPRAPDERWTVDEVLAGVGPQACEPGMCFRYEDLNFVAAGAVIEAVVGRPLARVLRERITQPLGLTKTWLQGFERRRGRVAISPPGLRDPNGNQPSTDFVTRTGYAGALATTARDLATWGDALFGGRVLADSSLAQMTDVERSAPLPCPELERCSGPGSYGLGIARSIQGGWSVWEHSGSTGALLVHFPEQHVTMAVLTNGAPQDLRGGGAPAVVGALASSIPALAPHFEVVRADLDGGRRQSVTRSGIAFAPAVSADGTRLAFATARDEGAPDIAVSDANGRRARVLTRNNARDSQPAWSPDGAHLTFMSERDGNPEIYVMDADGSHQQRITDDPSVDDAPAWSPDGRLFAYGHRDGDVLEIRVVRPDGTGTRTVISTTVHAPFSGFPTWSPDGTRLAFVGSDGGDADIQIVDFDGSDLTTVTTNHVPDNSPAWAPDGTLAFDRLGDIYTVTPGGAAPRPVALTAAEEWRPTWTPDSRSLFFTSNSAK